jgi:hypothetical protein
MKQRLDIAMKRYLIFLAEQLDVFAEMEQLAAQS